MKDPISEERATNVRELFEKVSALPPDQQTAFLETICGDDEDLRLEVQTLLLELKSVDSPLDDLVNGLIWPALDSLSSDPSKLQTWLVDLFGTDPDENDPLVGKSVSRFEIIEPIARGGMGIVYRAHDRTLDRTVALKFLPPSVSSDQGAKDRFIHEAKTASGLDHPNIASVHDIGETEDHQMYIAMGYYPGETLKEKIAKDPIVPDTAVGYAIQLATGLKEAHDHGVVHRDIKPGNVMITAEGTVVLLDFGLAKLSYETGYTQVGQMAGTIAYMSPEQARSEAIDQRTDIWSFGVVLYEMLTGKRPFGGENAQSAIRAILEEDPEAPVAPGGEIPAPLKTILGLCLTKDPKHRYQSAEDLLEDLQRFQEGLAPLRRGGRATWNRRLRRRRWTIFGAAVIPVVLFLILRYWPADPPDQAGDLDRARVAIESLEEGFRQDPNGADAWRIGSLYDHSRNRYDNAIFWYRRAHALQSENPDIPQRIADLYFYLGDLEVAAWWTERYLDIAPESELSDSLRIRVHLFRGEVTEAIEYFRSHPPDSIDSATACLDPLLEALLDTGNSEQALALCKQSYSLFLNLRDSGKGRATFRVVDDPFGLGQNRVLEFDPGKPNEEIQDKVPEIYETRSPPHHRKAVYRLPESAQISDSGPGQGKSTLYLKVGRPSINGLPGEVSVRWGLAAAEDFADYVSPRPLDYSILGSYEPDGIMNIHGGTSYIDLTESPLETDVYHEMWFVIDHANNTYDLHLRGGRHFPEQTKVYSGATYRKETREPLDRFVLITFSGSGPYVEGGIDPTYFDDIHIDPQRENLGAPDSGWILIDDFEDGDVSDWFVRLRRADRVLDISRTESAYQVARTLQANGEEVEAERILDAIQIAIARTWHPDLNSNVSTLTRIHAFRGERDKALEGIRKLIDSESFDWYWKGMFESNEFSRFHQDPDYQGLISKVDGKMGAQYARIREMEARGELAPIPSLPRDLVVSEQATFTRITEGAIVEDTGGISGMAWGDYDSDGYVDVALARDKTISLYFNNGYGTFNRVTEGIVVTDGISPGQPAWADQDNDGDLDLFVCTYDDSYDVFYRNDGDGSFTKVTEGDWVNRPSNSDVAAWGDYDRDGFVDLFVGHIREPNILYHNNGDGTMEPVKTEADGTTGYSNGCVWIDYDGDGDVDLFVGGQSQVQFRNDGDGTFEWIAYENGGIPKLIRDLAFSAADYDNDGDLDLLYNTWKPDPSSQLFRNEGEAGFVDVTRVLPSAGSIRANGSAWGDYDNDGHQDLFIANSYGYNLLYHNKGDGSFNSITGDPVVSEELRSLRCAWVDYDNDGDLDLFVTSRASTGNEPSCEFYRNDGGTNNWITLNLVGTLSNGSAIGAKVRATATIDGYGMTQLRQVGGNGDNPQELRVHFGLGDATIIDTLRVEWPSGQVQEVSDVAANQFLTITESSGATVYVPDRGLEANTREAPRRLAHGMTKFKSGILVPVNLHR